MRIPIDYDGRDLNFVRGEAHRLWLMSPEFITKAEIWLTSPPSNYRLVFEADLLLSEAIYLIENSNCDPDYLHFVQKRRELTERMLPKEGSNGITPAPRLIETHLSMDTLIFCSMEV